MDLIQPDVRNHKPTREAFRALVDATGLSLAAIARLSGISERRLGYLNAGTRLYEGRQIPVVMTFPEQYLLASIAYKLEGCKLRKR